MVSGKMLLGACDVCGGTIRYFIGIDQQGKLKYMCAICNNNIQVIDASIIRKLMRRKTDKGGDHLGV